MPLPKTLPLLLTALRIKVKIFIVIHKTQIASHLYYSLLHSLGSNHTKLFSDSSKGHPSS